MPRALYVVLAMLVVPAAAAAQAGPGKYLDVRFDYWGDEVCGLRADGVVFCWGRVVAPVPPPKVKGQPVQIPFAGSVTTLVEGGSYCSIAADGVTTCLETDGLKPTAKDVIVRSMTIGNGHACVLADDGGIYCQGNASFGQLGVGHVPMNEGGKKEFTRVLGNQVWKQVQAGNNFTCAMADDGAAWCWGNGAGGRLGAKDGAAHEEPEPVVGGHKFTQIAVGDEHACGRSADGAVFCWGRGKDGELGQDSLVNSRVPVRVTGSTSFASVFAGGQRSCGLAADGAAWCWGAGKHGQMGNGQLTERVPHPVAVTGGFKFAKLVLARWGGATCGVTTDGTVACWGQNNAGQLANGGKVDSSQPVIASLP